MYIIKNKMGAGASIPGIISVKDIDNEIKKHSLKQIYEHLNSADSLFRDIRYINSLDEFEYFRGLDTTKVEEELSKITEQREKTLLLATYLHIKKMETFISSLFVSIVESDTDILSYLKHMYSTETWPKSFQGRNMIGTAIHQKNTFIDGSLIRAVRMSRKYEFIHTKILTKMNSFVNVLEQLDGIYKRILQQKVSELA